MPKPEKNSDLDDLIERAKVLKDAPPVDPDDPRLQIPKVLESSTAGTSTPRPAEKPVNMADTARAWSTALDFVFTVLAGAGLGWLFDKWRGSYPTGAGVGLALGFILAFVRIVRATNKMK